MVEKEFEAVGFFREGYIALDVVDVVEDCKSIFNAVARICDFPSFSVG